MHGRDAGVLQLTGDVRLDAETLGGKRIGRIALGEQLDRDVAFESGVPGRDRRRPCLRGRFRRLTDNPAGWWEERSSRRRRSRPLLQDD